MMSLEKAGKIQALKSAASTYLEADIQVSDDLSEEGQNLMRASLNHPEITRIIKQIGGTELLNRSVSCCFIEKNKRLGEGTGLSIEIGLPIRLNTSTDKETELGLEATIKIEVCSSDHPTCSGGVWGMQVSVQACNYEGWPTFAHFETLTL